jgi:hypothetical protein
MNREEIIYALSNYKTLAMLITQKLQMSNLS